MAASRDTAGDVAAAATEAVPASGAVRPADGSVPRAGAALEGEPTAEELMIAGPAQPVINNSMPTTTYTRRLLMVIRRASPHRWLLRRAVGCNRHRNRQPFIVCRISERPKSQIRPPPECASSITATKALTKASTSAAPMISGGISLMIS